MCGRIGLGLDGEVMNGINTLADLKGYCVIDESGCWVWKGGYSQ